MRTHILLCLISCLSSTFCDAQYFKVVRDTDSTSWSVNVYPHIVSEKRTVAVDSINFAILHQVPGIIVDTDDASIHYGNMDYEVTRNDNQVLAFVMTYDVCGAYCETYHQSLIFDARSGKQIMPADIMTTEGAKLLPDSVRHLKNNRIKTFLKDSFDIFLSPENITEDGREIVRNMYEECIDTIEFYNEIDPDRFELYASSFSVTLERCLPHVAMADDVLWEYRFEFLAKDWRKYLTPYGRKIFKL